MGSAVVTAGQRALRVPAGLAGLLVALSGVSVALAHQTVRGFEAWLSASVASNLGVVVAKPLGSAVVFPLDGRLVGFTITPGCSVAFLLPFFFVVGGALLAVGRIGIGRAVATVIAVSATVFAVNQVRLLIVASSMQGWGFETGYERSHILLGSMASTIGLVFGVFLFLFLVTRPVRTARSNG